MRLPCHCISGGSTKTRPAHFSLPTFPPRFYSDFIFLDISPAVVVEIYRCFVLFSGGLATDRCGPHVPRIPVKKIQNLLQKGRMINAGGEGENTNNGRPFWGQKALGRRADRPPATGRVAPQPPSPDPREEQLVLLPHSTRRIFRVSFISLFRFQPSFPSSLVRFIEHAMNGARSTVTPPLPSAPWSPSPAPSPSLSPSTFGASGGRLTVWNA